MEATQTSAASRPAVYAGRFADQVSAAGPPGGPKLLGDWDALPWQLAPAVEGASALIVLDLFSFPFETLTGAQRNVPRILVLPSGFDVGFLDAVFGEAAFAQLGFFDRVAVRDTDTWEVLRRRRRWAAGQRIEIEDDRPERALGEVLALLEAEASPHGDVPGAGFDKATHRTQRAVLGPRFAAALAGRSADTPFEVLNVGAGSGRWTPSFDPAQARFTGVDVDAAAVAAARTNFPEARFDLIEPEGQLPYGDESFDLVFGVDVIQRCSTPVRLVLLSEMWRVARPGGRLVFLEDFVPGKPAPETAGPFVSVLEFVDLLLEATRGRVVLEHVESLRYPLDDIVRGGLLALSKLGTPKTW